MWSRAAREILLRLCRFPAGRIDLVFDLVSTPSIKDCERDRRSNEERSAPFKMFGPNQHRPQDFIKSLRNDNFKREIVRFLVESWSDDSLASILGDKVVHITHQSFCYRLQVLDDKVTMSQIDDLTSEHEKADTRMMTHVPSIPSPSTVVVRTCDTDVLVVATGNALELGQNKKVYLEIGIQSKNTLKFIDVTALAKKTWSDRCFSSSGLPCLFTGCDYNPDFARKGKIKPLPILESSPSICQALSSLGSSPLITEETMKKLEEFVCRIYGYKNLSSVNEARLQSCSKAYKPNAKKPMSSVKGVDGSSLPPCFSVLHQQVKRTDVICSSWNNATEFKPNVNISNHYFLNSFFN